MSSRPPSGRSSSHPHRLGLVLGVLAVFSLSACLSYPAPLGSEPPPEATTVPAPAVADPPPSCSGPSDSVSADATDIQGFSLAVSQATFGCASTVVLAAPNPQAAWTGALVAFRRRAPLLIVDSALTGRIAAELLRLDPRLVVLVGLDDLDAGLFAGYEILRTSPQPLDPPPMLSARSPDRVWVVSEELPLAAAVTWAAASGGDAFFTATGDLRGLPAGRKTLLRTARSVVPVGLNSDQLAQLDVVRAGLEIPGGGQILFPGRRLVAFYGAPGTSSLGVLGEQGPEDTLARLYPVAEQYAADGVPTVPTFEIIATVASARAGADGNYSAESSVEALTPWVEYAASAGVYVVLDLQPGRSTYLEQARRYEELLAQPHVGLALDPEWRLGPGQVHLRQIGSVAAEEVNQVADWLAGVVRRNRLPQKLLLVHQFKLSMIRNRDAIRVPSELALVIQMDGQGPLATKYDTWSAITARAQPGWWWGWKNFYDEDSPMARPDQVLDLQPTPVFVSFQ